MGSERPDWRLWWMGFLLVKSASGELKPARVNWSQGERGLPSCFEETTQAHPVSTEKCLMGREALAPWKAAGKPSAAAMSLKNGCRQAQVQGRAPEWELVPWGGLGSCDELREENKGRGKSTVSEKIVLAWECHAITHLNNILSRKYGIWCLKGRADTSLLPRRLLWCGSRQVSCPVVQEALELISGRIFFLKRIIF